MEGEVWTPAHVRYADKVAIRLAVEVVTGERHEHKGSYREAAKHLGAVGLSKCDVLQDLVGILSLYGVQPTPMVRRAVEDYE